MFAIRENADDRQRDRIEEALKPPATYRVNGAPVWYQDDDAAWAAWEKAARSG